MTSAGARSIRLSVVWRRSGIVGRSGPRSTPSGFLRSAFIVVRPPVLSRPVTTTVGLGASRALVASRSFSPTPARESTRSVRSRKISQSWRASSGLANTAGVNRAVLRTANPWKTRSYWSRSSADVGGRITSACRVVSFR